MKKITAGCFLSRWLSPETAPSMFYVSNVFYLHGVYGATLYITAWLLSDSVFAGMIAVTLFIVHRYGKSYMQCQVASVMI